MVRRISLMVVLLAATAVAVPHRPAEAASCRPALSRLTLAAPAVPGGASVRLTIVLTCGATGKLVISLKGFKGVTVPSVVHPKRGSSLVTVAVRTAVTRRTRRGTIEAAMGRRHRTVTLTVTRTSRTCRTPALAGFWVPAVVYAKGSPDGRIRLNCALAAPIRVFLTSSDGDLLVPAAVTVGRYYDSAAFALAPKADPAGRYTAVLTVRYRARSLSRKVTVDPGIASLQLPPCSVPNCVLPEVLFTGVVPAGGLTVRLASDNPAVTTPATFTFQAGSVGGQVAGVIVHVVSKNTKVTISATLGDRTLRASTILIPPWAPGDSLTLSAAAGPGDIYGQDNGLEYMATLSNPAPASGETVTFSASDPSIELQNATDFIAPGFTDGYLNINVANVTSAVHATIKATVGGAAASLPVTIEPGLISITNIPATISGGGSFVATVNLAGPVDTATVVSLQPTSGILTVPDLVTIPSGQSSAAFTATTTAVTADSDVAINASLGSTEITSGTVTVTP